MIGLRYAAAAALVFVFGTFASPQPTHAQTEAAPERAAAPDCSKAEFRREWMALITDPVPIGADFKAAEGQLPQPDFPRAARRRGVTGVVYGELRVDALGQAHDFTITKSPDPILSDAVMRSLECARFRAATVNGSPIATQVRLIYQFSFNQ
jgi:TonB family protein